MTEVRMKNLSRMHIHPNRMGAIRDSEVKQLFLNAKLRRLEFGGSKRTFLLNFGFNLLYSFNLSFYYKLDEVPGVAHGNLKIALNKKLEIYLAYVLPKGIHKFPH